MPSDSIQSILDFKTTLLSTTGYTVMLTVVVLLFWFNNRDERSLLTLGLGGLAGAVGALLGYAPPLLAPWPLLALSMGLLLLFHPLALIATEQMLGRRPSWRFCGLLMLLAMALFVCWGGPGGYARRVVVTSSTHLACWSAVIVLLLRERKLATPVGHWMALALALAVWALAAWRLTVAWRAGDAAFGRDGLLFNLFTSLGLFWTTFCFSIVLLFISYERLLQQLKIRAHHDSLTQLLNHRAFKEKAEPAFARALQSGEPLALLLIDLDHFKSINDRYGHQVGDAVLEQLAACLRKEARQSDLLGRHGGEEFVVLLPQTGAIEAYNAADRLRRAIANLHPEAGGRRLAISASIGVACLNPQEHSNLASLFLAADMLLYQAKHKGRDRVEMV
ncbi:hypothetical protein CEK28_15455 [Xenophilus sp. AP218F]|nr:hypothetical protein CEK28_15455 [Xenophilus sp. AP218F]